MLSPFPLITFTVTASLSTAPLRPNSLRRTALDTPFTESGEDSLLIVVIIAVVSVDAQVVVPLSTVSSPQNVLRIVLSTGGMVVTISEVDVESVDVVTTSNSV